MKVLLNQISAERKFKIGFGWIRACNEIENYVGRTFVNSKLCKKLVALLNAYRT